MNKAWAGAIDANNVGALQELLEDGADIDSRNQCGQTALTIAAHQGHSDMVRFLIENDADLDYSAKYNLSALMLAVIGGHQKVVRLLVDAGADRGKRGSGAPGFQDKTALDLAMEQGDVVIAEILRDK